MFPWAQFRRTKGAVKLHLLLDHDSIFPLMPTSPTERGMTSPLPAGCRSRKAPS
jgi:hypothetical protein